MLLFFEGTFTSLLKDKKKVIKKALNSRYKGFSSLFCLLMEGSGSGAESVQINYGSGSRRSTVHTHMEPDLWNTGSNSPVHLIKSRTIQVLV